MLSHFPSGVLDLETSLLQNARVCLYFITKFHSWYSRVQSCPYIFFPVPLEQADRWKMTTLWVNQSDALYLSGNIVFSGAQMNLFIVLQVCRTVTHPAQPEVAKFCFVCPGFKMRHLITLVLRIKISNSDKIIYTMTGPAVKVEKVIHPSARCIYEGFFKKTNLFTDHPLCTVHV